MESRKYLDKKQIQFFQDYGYLVCQSQIGEQLLQKLDEELDAWIEESRSHAKNFGTTYDGKARFDLEVGHSKEHPKMRRVANPADVSKNFQKVLWDSPMVDMVSELIGPSIRFHHCKLNIKLPGMKTVVYYHQDHSYDPHTNDDMLAILLMLDDANEENGCLWVVPGSHRKRYSHFKNGEYVGAIDSSYNDEFEREGVPIIAERGEVCFMHTWTVHGSDSNRSTNPRRLLICDYTAADAYPLLSPALPSAYTGKLVRGVDSGTARLRNDVIEIRTPYQYDSFFGVQGQPTAQ